jgi:ribonuclease HI
VTIIYTDGACIGNPGPGGWAWAVPDGHYASGFSPDTTNQRMELIAALEALRAIPGPVEVRSDSKYVVDCFNGEWYVGWEAKGWKTAGKQPVKNQDLLRPMVQLFHQRGNELTFTWVKGHSEEPMNDIVDRLAVQAATEQSPRSGSGTPTDLGAPDVPAVQGRRRSGGGTLDSVAGWRIVVLGHRPPQLGGYDPNNPRAAHVKAKLAEMMAGLRVVHPDLIVLTGLDLGAEMLAAEAADEAGVPYVAVLPYPNPDAMWPELTRARYRRAVAVAAGRRSWLVCRSNGLGPDSATQIDLPSLRVCNPAVRSRNGRPSAAPRTARSTAYGKECPGAGHTLQLLLLAVAELDPRPCYQVLDGR